MHYYPSSSWNRFVVALLFFFASGVHYLTSTGSIVLVQGESEALALESAEVQTRRATPRLTVANITVPGRYPRVWAGDRLRLTVRGRPNTAFRFCQSRPAPMAGANGCYSTKSYSTDATGVWTTTIATKDNDVGPWSRWVDMYGLRSNTTTYQVVGRPEPKLSVANRTVPGRFPVVRLGDQLQFILTTDFIGTDYAVCLNGQCQKDERSFVTNQNGVDSELIDANLYRNPGQYSIYLEVFGEANTGSVITNIVNFTVSRDMEATP